MGMKEYSEAVSLMDTHPEHSDFLGERPNGLIALAQKALNLRFPPSYRQFLKERGAGGFGTTEIYGIIRENFEASGVPDAVWLTLQERKQASLPQPLIIVYATGDGGYYCLDTSVQDGNQENPIIAFYPGFPMTSQPKERVATDFGEWLLTVVRREISRLE
jgi:hypothetical protein